MKIIENHKRPLCLRAIILAFVMVLLFAANLPPAWAAVRVEPSREASLALEYQYKDKAVSGAEFSLYRAADISESARFTLCGDFAEYQVEVNELDTDGGIAAASTLATYVKADNIAALETKTTDQEGKIQFETKQTGLYLLIGKDIRKGRTTYKVKPFLVSLPTLTEEDSWDYDVISKPKCEVTNHSSPGGSSDNDTKLEVIKIWQDGGNGENRPDDITVSLLRDGKTYDTVTLNVKNHWRHTWNALSDRYDWSIVEVTVPAEYTVTYTESSTRLIITNTFKEETREEPPPGTDKTPPSGTEGTPPGDSNTGGADSSVIAAGGRLPQTGLLWWPVPLLAASGLLVFSAGWLEAFRERRKKQ